MTQTIQSLTTSGFKGIPGEVTIYPGGDKLLVIAGPNSSGKSSFIDGIAEIFDPKGVKLTPLPRNLNADGSTYAEVVTDKFTYRRDWKKDGTPGELTVTAAGETKAEKGGKELIAKAQAGLIFRVSDFTTMPGKAQRELMLKYVSLPFDLIKIEAEKAKLAEERTIIGRDEKQLAGQLAGFPPVIPDLPTVETPSSAILSQLDQVRAHNAEINMKHAEAQRTANIANAAHAEVVRIHALYEAANAALSEASVAAVTASEVTAGLEFKDETALVKALAGADEFNASIRKQNERAAAAAAHAAKKAEYESHTAQIAAIDKTKADGLAAAVFPVGGWSIDEDGITKDGVPFSQFNTAQKTVGALLLATLARPDLQLVMVSEGDMLDNETLEGVKHIAEERGCYILMERDRDNSRELAKAVFSNGTAAVAA